jgi:hypothetical protein
MRSLKVRALGNSRNTSDARNKAITGGSPITATSTTVHAITNAQSGLSQDQRHRQRAYFLSMMLRTACFITAIIVHNPYRPFAIAGALILPYIAVVMANAGKEQPGKSNAFVIHAPRKSLPQSK